MSLLKPIDDISEELNIAKIRSWCDYYSLGSPIAVTIDEAFDGPAAIDLSDISKPRIILNPKLMKEKLGYSDTQMYVDLFHEIEHYIEESQMKSTQAGKAMGEKRDKRLQEAGMRGMTLHKIENVLRDCFVDDRVISPTKAPVLKKDLEKMFTDSLYPTIDYEKDPLHMQLLNAIGREYRIPGERCRLDPRVRIILDRLKRNGSIKDATTGNMAERLQNIWANIEPHVMKLFEEDLKNRKDQDKKESEDGKGGDDLQTGNTKSGGDSGSDSKNYQTKDKGANSNKTAQDPKKDIGNQPDKDKSVGSDEGKDAADKQSGGSGIEQDKPRPDTDAQPEGGGRPADRDSQDIENGGDKKETRPSEGKKPNKSPQSKDEGNASGKMDTKSIFEKMKKKLSDILKGENISNDEDEGDQEMIAGSETEASSDNPDQKGDIPEGDVIPEGKEEPQEKDPDGFDGKNPFENYYKDRSALSKLLEEALGKDNLDKLEKAMTDSQKQLKKPKSSDQLEKENRVKNMGVDMDNEKKVQEAIRNLDRYDQFLEQLQKLINPKTGEFVMTEIEELFEKIRSRRLKPKYKSRGPVDMDRGVRLDGSNLAEGIADLESGDLDPHMFEEDYMIDKEEMRTGCFELTIITDGSGSMADDGKNEQQKIACLLIFEALKRLHDRLADAVYEMKSPIEFTTSGIMFKGGKELVDIKKESSDFTDKDRLDCFNKLDYCKGGSTNDYDAIDSIIKRIESKDQEYLDDLRSGKIKNIVVVLTDGDSTNAPLLKQKLNRLRSYGVIVYAIGITLGGVAVKKNYGAENESQGFGKVCPDVEGLSVSLEEILFSHLEIL